MSQELHRFQKSYYMSTKRFFLLLKVASLALCASLLASATQAQEIWKGEGKKAHAEGCPRLETMLADPQIKAKMSQITPKDMMSERIELCSKCPDIMAKLFNYDPKMKVYRDALWFRVHAENCPELILKEHKKTMTLAEADLAGARIGESGQSGRTNCCFFGYQRQHPQKKLTDETLLCGNDNKRNVKHIAGCHRYWPDRTDMRRPLKDWVADGFKVCDHCIERGPSVASITDEEWAKLGTPFEFVAPSGWSPTAFFPDRRPSQEELELLIQETLAKSNGIQELQFTDPLASMENFMVMRFFFPVHNWLDFYMAYRATGDERLREKLLESARHYNQLAKTFPSVAQAKASTPEGIPFMLTMAASARITLQLALKKPDSVSPEQLAEAEDFLKTMYLVLHPTCEGTRSKLDQEMRIPQELADDFRTRAFNRSMNGIGTLGIFAAAMEDLQTLKNTNQFQKAIQQYQHVAGEYIKHWFSKSHFCDKNGGFYYSYKPEDKAYEKVDGCPIFKRPEDAGHYSHTMQGVVFLYESAPELGANDQLMTAVASAIYHNSTTKIQRHGEAVLSGHIECPTMSQVDPYGSKRGGHQYSPARERFYVLEAFKEGMIDGLCDPLSSEEKAAANSEYDKRLATLYAQYANAIRKDRSLIHLGERM
ncbi:MAG TPA: hypothetical protein DCX06_01405 [Opitutae bacterium]|nr:hypothetical protein [Opitutae bacterium]